MSKKSNIIVLFLALFTTFFLFTSSSFAGAMSPPLEEIPPYKPESNCCFPHGGGGCEIKKDGKYECCVADLNGDASESAFCVNPEDLLDSSIYGSIEPPGCDDSGCQNTVCQIEPSCCMNDPRFMESRYIGGGWAPECAALANRHCTVCGGNDILEQKKSTDKDPIQLYSFIDLRDRESFVQVTNLAAGPATIHVQIFDVSNECNENNFFDVYTGNDTHIYDLRNITTNDGNPSGVVLPDNAYGMVVITAVTGVGGRTVDDNGAQLVGNFRILDDAGYEYRTNMYGIQGLNTSVNPTVDYYINYNVKGNVTLSDVVGLTLAQNPEAGEVIASPLSTFGAFDIDIYNLNEVPFSCRDIIFACIDEDSIVAQQLLENVGVGSIASFEYGINDAIPHSRGGDVLCSGNNISEGFVVLRPEVFEYQEFIGYVGLNNGNGRGSMDSFWEDNFFTASQFLALEPF